MPSKQWMRTNKREPNGMETYLDWSLHEMCDCKGPLFFSNAVDRKSSPFSFGTHRHKCADQNTTLEHRRTTTNNVTTPIPGTWPPCYLSSRCRAASIRLHVRFGDSTVLDLEANVIFLDKYVPRPWCVPAMFSLLVTKNLMRLSESAPEPIRRAPKAILRLGSGQHFLSASFGLVGKDEHINERICKNGNGRNQSQRQ